MNITRCTLIAIFVALSAHSRAQSPQPPQDAQAPQAPQAPQVPQARPCISKMPESLQSTLEQDNWKILQPADLGDDLHIFKANHPGECPGVTEGNFYPKANSSFIVAMIQRDNQKIVAEKLLLVAQKKNRTETSEIFPPAAVTAPSVVWRIPPGHWRGLDGEKASIKRYSFVSEQIFASARQYYYDGSHLKSLVLSR